MNVALPFRGSFPVSQRFGSNAHAYHRFELKGHNGLDFALPTGTTLLACVSGVITERRNDPTGYGQYAVITDPSGGQWLYGHGSSWSVREGQLVEEGQPLGKSGATGNSTAPHLHWAHRPYGYDRTNGYSGYVNPRPFLNGVLSYRVLLQAGHYPQGGGAPGEAAWTMRLAQALAPKLEAAGVKVDRVGDFFNTPPPQPVTWDYDLFLSLHYDAAIYGQTTGNSGCCIARGAAETEHWEADRFIAHWLREYPAPHRTPVPLHQERVGPNMTAYYAYRHLTYVTPGVVIEHGVGAPGAGLDARYLHDRIDEVASADAAAVLAYFGLPAAAQPPGEEEEEEMALPPRVFDDAHLIAAQAAIFGPFWTSPDFGIPKTWREALMRGKDLGAPTGPEQDMGDGHRFQRFERGTVFWHDAKGGSWIG